MDDDVPDRSATPTPSVPDQPAPGQPLLPGQRMVSGDEVLDPEAGAADREPLFRLPALTGSPRLRRFARATLAALAVAAVAGAAGTATHTADVHRAADQLRSRTMLRLVGGGAAMTVPEGLAPGSGPLAAQLAISVRNDGAQPEAVTSLTLDALGVDIRRAPAPVTVLPGTTVAIQVPVTVDCDRQDLAERPKSVTLQVRADTSGGRAVAGAKSGARAGTEGDPTADPGAAPKTTSLTLPFSGAGNPSADLLHGATPDTFYLLCGVAQLTGNGPVSSYVGPTVRATPAKPTFEFRIDVRSDSEHGGVLATETPAQTYPGLTVSGDLPAASVPLADATPVRAGVTVRVTDCSALGTALAAENGVQNLVEVVASDLPLASEPADPRFRNPRLAMPLVLTGDVSTFEQDLLLDLVAACPGLK